MARCIRWGIYVIMSAARNSHYLYRIAIRVDMESYPYSITATEQNWNKAFTRIEHCAGVIGQERFLDLIPVLTSENVFVSVGSCPRSYLFHNPGDPIHKRIRYFKGKAIFFTPKRHPVQDSRPRKPYPIQRHTCIGQIREYLPPVKAIPRNRTPNLSHRGSLNTSRK